jgi:hypothetical protein
MAVGAAGFFANGVQAHGIDERVHLRETLVGMQGLANPGR